MMGQGMTKFTIVAVLLGVVLAVAIFRPQIIPVEAGPVPGGVGGEGAEPPSASPIPQEELDRRQVALDGREAELDRRQVALDGREAVLNQRQAELDGREAVLNQRQAELEGREDQLGQSQVELDGRKAELDGREASLVQRQTELEQREVVLDQRQAELEGRETELSQHRIELDERTAVLEEQAAFLQAAEARLRNWQADLAGREQEIQGFLRWSVVAAVVSGLLAVPSVLVLVALMQQDRLMPEEDGRPAQPSRTHREKRVAVHGNLVTVAPVPTYGDNGRCRESVRHPA
jgi:uncharacterized protein (DUF3084 family)